MAKWVAEEGGLVWRGLAVGLQPQGKVSRYFARSIPKTNPSFVSKHRGASPADSPRRRGIAQFELRVVSRKFCSVPFDI